MVKVLIITLVLGCVAIVSCTHLRVPVTDKEVIRPRPIKVTKQEENDAMNEAKRNMSMTRKLETELKRRKIVLGRNKPGYLNALFKKPSKLSRRKGEEGELITTASVALSNRKQLNPDENGVQLQKIKLPRSLPVSCFDSISCKGNTKYRTIDGSCNNLQNPKWGMIQTAFVRLLPPKYGNGIDTPRDMSMGEPLPSAREVSVKATNHNSVNSKFTHMLMQWGQFLDHDITHTPVVSGDGFTIKCCPGGGTVVYRRRPFTHPACFPIEVSENDPFYGQFGIRCLEFVRSLAVPTNECTFGCREQMNQITAFIDASNIYGSEEEIANSLRKKQGGKLLTQPSDDGSRLLPAEKSNEGCPASKRPCFKSGDVRTNEQPNLAIMHTIWMREHNRIASFLKEKNKNWDDEKLYQEARKIVGAEMQHITYNEFLPIVLGEKFMKNAKLLPKKNGYSNVYAKDVNPSISNSFATAAYRFGHSLIQSKLRGFDSSYSETSNTALHKLFFNPALIYTKGRLDEMVRGLTVQRAQTFDNSFSRQVRELLFASSEKKDGLDLVALNIQRGRDHGLKPYGKFRKACNLGTSKSSLKKSLGKNFKVLKSIYGADVSRADLFIGGVLEKRAKGAIVGKTFRCIIANQFERLKVGDRFYYENGKSQKTRFTQPQLKEIRKVTLARILCDNTEISETQPEVFKHITNKNKVVSCDDTEAIPTVNLNKWNN